MGHIKCIDFVFSLDKQLTYEDLRIGYANDFGGSSEYSDPADEKKLKACKVSKEQLGLASNFFRCFLVLLQTREMHGMMVIRPISKLLGVFGFRMTEFII